MCTLNLIDLTSLAEYGGLVMEASRFCTGQPNNNKIEMNLAKWPVIFFKSVCFVAWSLSNMYVSHFNNIF